MRPCYLSNSFYFVFDNEFSSDWPKQELQEADYIYIQINVIPLVKKPSYVNGVTLGVQN